MKVLPTKLRDVVLVEPKIFGDERGFFVELFQELLEYQNTLIVSLFDENIKIA